MKILVAMDSFKGSLSSLEAGYAVQDGILKADPEAQFTVKPLADGGEGTVSALTEGLGGRIVRVSVTNPVGKQTEAEYGILPDEETAVMEISQACGLTLINEQERNPMYTTTYGVGEMILDALRKDVRHFIIGIGGSATNDGGIGMLQALGFGVLDQSGNDVPFGARGLESIAKITNDSAVKELSECTFRIACDVSNPLFGEHGASHIFGHQKGADPSMVLKMDQWMKHYAEAAKVYNQNADAMTPGAGAAGGLGFAFLTFTNASLESGIKIVLEETKFEDSVKIADIVVTGEGKLDSQSAMGKAPVGVSE
ncbi:MAG: glycerate kinase, partial [Eubacteriales bacterium]|nr:glycerate kinase [Eubacteriales bacterium]